MGTRSLTRVYDEGAQLINMYRQMDGYPSGHGQDLARFLDGLQIVNGLNSSQQGRIANGAGCLAAQLVAHFKTGPGGIYLYPVTALDADQEYEYHILVDDEQETVAVKVYEMRYGAAGRHQLFEGNVAEFKDFCEHNDE